MIREIRLVNFKGFQRFKLRLGDKAVLVGPNNAGKSSAIGALRAVAGMRRRASRTRAVRYTRDGGYQPPVWNIPTGFGLNEENLRFDFLPHSVRLLGRFANGSRLQAVWPGIDELDLGGGEGDDESEPDPYFYLLDRGSNAITTPSRVKELAPDIGIVPILTPIDLHEMVRSRDTVVRNLSGRLASRHFRNQLLLLAEEPADDNPGRTQFDEFREFALTWLMDTNLDAPVRRNVKGGSEIDVFFYERRRARELAWAGDGFQVFLQLLSYLSLKERPVPRAR